MSEGAGSEGVAPDGVVERRSRMAALGERVRELGRALALTEVADAELEEAAKALDPVIDLLRRTTRPITRLSSVDDLAVGIRMFNPVSGAASPVAPPLVMEDGPGWSIGQVTLSSAHEGPFTYSHGGVIAALLDDILGRVASGVANPVVTSRLSVRYRRPVPLGVPLRVTGRVEETEGRRLTLVGAIATEAEPETALAEAEGWFVQLSSDQATSMFGSDRLHGSI